ncbi:hypothetical protein KG007_08620 [Alistipes sp. kh20]|uniref:hypothetical protein n=1 Tax=Alistipes montrealensis TaxID=2834113 RepID=UPI001BCB17C2|nr:hypothetical protein [Alistipes montrealensis]MBS4766270.1 hypothetical protein [Alistipes montrealensis]
MKRHYFLLLLYSITIFSTKYIIAQTMNTPSERTALTDSILIVKAQTALLKHGPDYYQKGQKPSIAQEPISNDITQSLLYCVTFPNDKFVTKYGAKVYIRANGNVTNILFGNGLGFDFTRATPQEIDKLYMPFHLGERAAIERIDKGQAPVSEKSIKWDSMAKERENQRLQKLNEIKN